MTRENTPLEDKFVRAAQIGLYVWLGWLACLAYYHPSLLVWRAQDAEHKVAADEVQCHRYIKWEHEEWARTQVLPPVPSLGKDAKYPHPDKK